MQRKLASIQKIKDIKPIPGADQIEVVQINNWNVVTKKGEYKVDDLCIYCEIDSFLPVREEFEFLRKSSYKKMADGNEGFRLKTIRLKGQVSQGLVLPISTLNSKEPADSEMVVGVSEQPWGDQLQLGPYDDAFVIEEGADVTDLLKIVKYEPPVPASLAGIAKGLFPSFIPKTDEERVQNLTLNYDEWRANTDLMFYATEKLDGSSTTYYVKDGEFGVCSRNLELVQSEDNTLWTVAKTSKIEEKLKSLNLNIAIQGEMIGEGIQGNPYKIKGQSFRMFNAFLIDDYSYLDFDNLVGMSHALDIEMVPIITSNFELPETIDSLLEEADAKSALNQKTDREGLVIRSHDKKISFKAISNAFLLAEK